MLVILSPSKTMDCRTADLQLSPTLPEFSVESQQLVGYLKKMSVSDLMLLMSISEKLAIQNRERFGRFGTAEAAQLKSGTAIHTFQGEVYNGLDAFSMSSDDLQYAQQHLRILSGLYGSLRPLDVMQEYRLEIATRLKTKKHSNLYQYWSPLVTHSINRDIHGSGSDYLVNLASDEYFKCLNIKSINAKIIGTSFFEMKNGKRTFVSFSAKKARGLMAAFIIKNRITHPSGMQHFISDGYQWDAETSTESNFVFVKS